MSWVKIPSPVHIKPVQRGCLEVACIHDFKFSTAPPLELVLGVGPHPGPLGRFGPHPHVLNFEDFWAPKAVCGFGDPRAVLVFLPYTCFGPSIGVSVFWA